MQHIYICIYIVVTMKQFSENKVLNIVNVELYQLKLHLLLHAVTLCFTYADDDDDLQTYMYIYVRGVGCLGVVGVCCPASCPFAGLRETFISRCGGGSVMMWSAYHLVPRVVSVGMCCGTAGAKEVFRSVDATAVTFLFQPLDVSPEDSSTLLFPYDGTTKLHFR